MKIDKHNYRHSVYLKQSTIYVLLALAWRPFKARNKKTVILYGHKLNGNLLAFAKYYQENKSKEFDLFYATIDPDYYKALQAEPQPIPIINLNRFKDHIKVAQSSAIIASHQEQMFVIYKKLTSIKFINVWHGIGFKGHHKKSFKFTRSYDEIWMSSPTLKKIFRDLFGVVTPIYVTGFARSDDAANKNFSTKDIKKKYGIKGRFKKLILVAPTWNQNVEGRNIIPFDVSENTFFARLAEAAEATNSLIIFRTHLNTKGKFNISSKNIRFMPYAKYPVVEDFLYMADVLVTDWSSISFDYLPLKRPTIYMDMKHPFEAGFSLDPKHRFGPIAKNVDELKETIKKYVIDPGSFNKKYGKKMQEAIEAGYGDTLDGKSAERYYERLKKLIDLK